MVELYDRVRTLSGPSCPASCCCCRLLPLDERDECVGNRRGGTRRIVRRWLCCRTGRCRRAPLQMMQLLNNGAQDRGAHALALTLPQMPVRHPHEPPPLLVVPRPVRKTVDDAGECASRHGRQLPRTTGVGFPELVNPTVQEACRRRQSHSHSPGASSRTRPYPSYRAVSAHSRPPGWGGVFPSKGSPGRGSSNQPYPSCSQSSWTPSSSSVSFLSSAVEEAEDGGRCSS